MRTRSWKIAELEPFDFQMELHGLTKTSLQTLYSGVLYDANDQEEYLPPEITKDTTLMFLVSYGELLSILNFFSAKNYQTLIGKSFYSREITGSKIIDELLNQVRIQDHEKMNPRLRKTLKLNIIKQSLDSKDNISQS